MARAGRGGEGGDHGLARTMAQDTAGRWRAGTAGCRERRRRAGDDHLPAHQRRLRDRAGRRPGRPRRARHAAQARAGPQPGQHHDLRRRPDLALGAVRAHQGQPDDRPDEPAGRRGRRARQSRVRLRPRAPGRAGQGLELPLARHQRARARRQARGRHGRDQNDRGRRLQDRLLRPPDARDRRPVLARARGHLRAGGRDRHEPRSRICARPAPTWSWR